MYEPSCPGTLCLRKCEMENTRRKGKSSNRKLYQGVYEDTIDWLLAIDAV